jgi:transcriptional regulator with XRE-family HTH domain
VGGFDLAGALRRVRRRADLSQRELAHACQVSPSVIAHAEAGRRGLTVQLLAAAAELAGLRLALIDETGAEVPGMRHDTVRDMGGRQFPAHLDTVHSDDRWWRYEHRPDRVRPWFTFDRDREGRDAGRRSAGTPDDHHLPGADDSPQERAAARRRAYLRAAAEERQRAFLAGELSGIGLGFECTCPTVCDELDDRSGRPVHAEECPCLCDLA